MSQRYLLLATDELQEIVEIETGANVMEPQRSAREVSMALELLEYRKILGPLDPGLKWLAKE